MHWHKLGLIFKPDINLTWMRSHAQLPVPVPLGGSRYRVFFASRNELQRSHVGAFDIDLDHPDRILSMTRDPLLKPGPTGYFDGDGVYVASIVPNAQQWYFYTIGWNVGGRSPLFYTSIGLAHSSNQGLTVEKEGVSPIMQRSEHDPCLVTAPMVLRDRNRWMMWYVSGFDWEDKPSGLQSKYHIKYAYSMDGKNWHRDGHVCLATAEPDETNISRFWVLPSRGGYHAWYGFNRGPGYRIGYARSVDGLHWTRYDDQAGIGLSDSGWDSQAIAYPAVVHHQGHWYMFYNGNGYGKDGIGLAVTRAGE